MERTNNNFKLIGNDYNKKKIKQWYLEEETYHNNIVGDRWNKYPSIYEVFNNKYGFDKHFKPTSESRVLSFGCAEGLDLEKLYKKYSFLLYGLESSNSLINKFKRRFPKAEIKKADQKGKIDFEDNFFDYISILGVLHHIPNISFVLSELTRVLKPNGIMIIREPISSMRPTGVKPIGLSPNERGIPIDFFIKEFEKLNLKIIKYTYSFFPPLVILIEKFRIPKIILHRLYYLDKFLSTLSSNNLKYQRTTILERCAAGSAYYVVKKC